MDRRKFLRNTSLTGLSITALAAASCHSPADGKPGNATDSGAAGSNGTTADAATAAGSGKRPSHFSLKEETTASPPQKKQKKEYKAPPLTALWLQPIRAID